MKKILLFLSLIFSLCMISGFVACSKTNNQSASSGMGSSENEVIIKGTETSFAGFTKVDDTTYAIKVPNTKEIYIFSEIVKVAEDSSWKLTADIYGIVDIPSKIGTLEVGDNTYYCMVTDSKDNVKMYTLQVRRKPLYTVSFETNGGSSVPSKQIEEDSLIVNDMPIPQKADYIFSHWDFDFNTPITSNLTIRAVYNTEQYNINYVLNGGVNNTNNPSTYGIDDYPLQLLEPTRTGYFFDGWYLNNDFTGERFEIVDNLRKDITLYACWENYTQGLTFRLDGNSYCITGYNGTEKNIKITQTHRGLPIKYIYSDSFKNNTIIESIIIPSNIENIGYNVFQNCINLTTVEIDKNSTVEYLGRNLFSGCTNLKTLSLPNNLEEVMVGAFDKCYQLEYNQKNNGSYLGNSDNPYHVLMKYDSGALRVTIDSNTRVIAPNAFKNYYSNIGDTLYIPNNVISIGCSAFENSTLRNIYFYEDSKLKYIYDCAFKNSKIMSFVVPKGVKYIGAEVFANCGSLTSIDYTKTTNNLVIYTGSFTNCTYLRSLYIPLNVTLSNQGDYFKGCLSTLIISTAHSESVGWAYGWNKYSDTGFLTVIWDSK